MKSKLIILTVLFSVCALFTAAQDLRVSVHDQNAPLPYANVYVNEVQVAIADSLGRTTLSELKVGDVVSSSYIGMQPAAATYDGVMRECVLTHLEERTYAVGEVSVSALDGSGWKAFRKYARPDDPPVYDCRVNGKFSATLTFPDGISPMAAGSFGVENRIPPAAWKTGEVFQKHYFREAVKIETTSDSTRVDNYLPISIHSIFSNACQTIGRIAQEHRYRGANSGMSYLGKDQGEHHFRYVYSSPKSDYNYQILFAVDENSKKISTIRFQNVWMRSDGQFSRFIVSADCRSYTSRNPRRPTVALPLRITCHADQPNLIRDFVTADFTLFDISIIPLK